MEYTAPLADRVDTAVEYTLLEHAAGNRKEAVRSWQLVNRLQQGYIPSDTMRKLRDDSDDGQNQVM